MARRRIPFHGRRQTRIKVSLALGNDAELQRGAGGLQVSDRVPIDPLLGDWVEMGPADDRAPSFRRSRANGNGMHFAEGEAACTALGLELMCVGAADIEQMQGRRADCARNGTAAIDQCNIDCELGLALDDSLVPSSGSTRMNLSALIDGDAA
jgi:hypothetical protein